MHRYAAIAVIASLLFATGELRAQTDKPPCDAREKILDWLASQYNEIVIARGLTNTGNMIEITRSDKGDWTLVVTMPNRQSCMMGAGDALRILEVPEEKGQAM